LDENEAGVGDRGCDAAEVHSYHIMQQPGQEPHKGEVPAPLKQKKGADKIHPHRKEEDHKPHKTNNEEHLAGYASEDQNLPSATGETAAGVKAEEAETARTNLAAADAGMTAVTNEK